MGYRLLAGSHLYHTYPSPRKEQVLLHTMSGAFGMSKEFQEFPIHNKREVFDEVFEAGGSYQDYKEAMKAETSVQGQTSMAYLDKLLKDVYLEKLNDQLTQDSLFFARVEGEFPPRRKPSFKKKWKTFWKHIPDFIEYIRNYKYEVWRYYEDY